MSGTIKDATGTAQSAGTGLAPVPADTASGTSSSMAITNANDETPYGHYHLEEPIQWKAPGGCTAYFQTRRNHMTKYGPPIDRLKLSITPITTNIVRIRLTDPENIRWEIPQHVMPLAQDVSIDEKSFLNTDYDIVMDQENESGQIEFAIKRKQDGTLVFDSTGLQTSFCDQYMEISTNLPQGTVIYGLGEVTGDFQRQPGLRWAFWARDAQTPLHENAYSSFPMFVGMNEGKAFGVYLHNSNALDMIYQGSTITYKVTGGVLDFFVFLGDTYEDVTRQYHKIIGFPQLPPYYSFGYHQCRWYYETTELLEEARQKNLDAKIPCDTIWLDIDYMIAYKLFTLDESRYPNFPAYVRDKIHKDNQKLVAIVDPGVKCNVEGYEAWSRGVDLNVFIKDRTGQKDSVGKVWPGHVVFPDWLHPGIHEYWTEMLRKWLKIMPVDGIWHDMNECSNFVDGDVFDVGGEALVDEILIPTDEETVKEMADAAARGIKVEDDGKRGAEKEKPKPAVFDPSRPIGINNPPYSVNHGADNWPLNARSIPVDAQHHAGITEYDVHNLFGHLNCAVTHKSMLELRPDQRPFILTRSGFAGTGKYASKWLGDNYSTWDSMKWSISGMFNMQIYGIPHIGADIGGFNGATEHELLLRWFQLGSMYPFCRNHNMPKTPPQEAHINPETAENAKKYLTLRYRLLPFWYTAFANVNKSGGSVVQPVWAVYPPQPTEAADVLKLNNHAFLVNKSILVAPVLAKGETEVRTWLPAGPWYDVETGACTDNRTDRWMDIEAPITKMPMFYRGGTVIPMHYRKEGLTTVDFRAGGLSLMVPMDNQSQANGELYLDDGKTFSSGKSRIRFAATLSHDGNELQLLIQGHFGYQPDQKKEIRIREVVVIDPTFMKAAPTDIVLDSASSHTIRL